MRVRMPRRFPADRSRVRSDRRLTVNVYLLAALARVYQHLRDEIARMYLCDGLPPPWWCPLCGAEVEAVYLSVHGCTFERDGFKRELLGVESIPGWSDG